MEFRTSTTRSVVVRELFFFYSSSGQRTGFPSIVHAAHSQLEDVTMSEVCCKVANLNIYVSWCVFY